MLRTRAEQVSWWESVLPAEVLRLPEELALTRHHAAGVQVARRSLASYHAATGGRP